MRFPRLCSWQRGIEAGRMLKSSVRLKDALFKTTS